jgi:prepilin-type N-terminal cleavage/methylation domain-containing protein/prepilin-type processing-associated H-X9-DG protein
MTLLESERASAAFRAKRSWTAGMLSRSWELRGQARSVPLTPQSEAKPGPASRTSQSGEGSPQSRSSRQHGAGGLIFGRGGFSLLEMFAVLAVVGVLISLVAAGFSRTQIAAQRTQCLNNLRQIGLAIRTYADEHGGHLPPTRHTATAGQAWVQQLRPYLENVDKIRISPADPRGADRLRRGSTSYLANDLVFDARTDAFGNVLDGSIGHMLRIERPAATILAVTASDNRGVGPTNDHTHANRWTSWQLFLADVEVDRHRVGNRATDRLRGDANYLYADGSVRNIPAQDMKAHLDAGHNPGRPGQAPL